MKRSMLLVPLLAASLLSGCNNNKAKLKVLIVPKFEIGEMSGDDIGESQLFYEHYLSNAKKEKVDLLPETSSFYLNKDNGVGLLITGSGKTAAGLSFMALLSNKNYDFSSCYILSVGCAGGSSGYTMVGDVVLGTYIVDYDLGHHVDTTELADPETPVPWFHDDSYDTYCHKELDIDLSNKVYDLIKDSKLETTELTREKMKEFYPDIYREPKVIKGTIASSDNFWKGQVSHDTCEYIVNYHKTPDPYAVTDMEEIAVANTISIFDMLKRYIPLRAIVNMDVFLGEATPESTWNVDFNDKVVDENSETFDAFVPSMYNLFNISKTVIDKILANTF